MSEQIADWRPRRFVSVDDAVEYSPFGRSTLYELAGQYEGLFLKMGSRIVVDLVKHDEIMAALPAAKIKQPSPKTAA